MGQGQGGLQVFCASAGRAIHDVEKHFGFRGLVRLGEGAAEPRVGPLGPAGVHAGMKSEDGR